MSKKKVRKSKKKSSTRNVRENRRNYVEEKESGVIKVISTIIALFFVVFVALSNFSLCGSIGEIVRNIVLSCFGTFGYFFPLVIAISIVINLFSEGRIDANIKIYSILIFYVMVICLIESIFHDFSIENDLSDAISMSIVKAKGLFSFDKDYFSGGFIGTSISFILFKAIGKVGSITLFATISIITFLLIFGLGVSKFIFKILKAIVMFIPNIFIKARIKKAEDDMIAIDNENLLNQTIEKSKNINKNIDFSEKHVFPADNSLFDKLNTEEQPEVRKRVFDTSRVRITTDDVQSRFFDANKYNEDKDNLLEAMKKKSINEIMYENKEVKASDFFYTDGMKPVDELSNIEIPPIKNEEEDIYKEEKRHEEIRNKEVKDIISERYGKENEASNNKISDIIDKNADVEIKNDTIKNSDLFTLETKKKKKKYKFPPLSYLSRSEKSNNGTDPSINEKAEVLVETLKQFGVGASLTNITVGPSVTRFEIKPDLGVKVSKVLSLEDDLKLALAASEIRIEAPIPGKPAVGIEIPNAKSSGVLLGDIISSREFRDAESKLTVAIGKDISGRIVTTDLRKMPHLLIAGATGSGKSVCINSLITSLIYKSAPEDVRLIMVDPKVVELQVYNGIPHLLIPVVTNPKKAAGALNWAVNEMTRRYNLLVDKNVRDIESYNKTILGEIDKIAVNENNEAELSSLSKLPYIVIIIDEFADLMMVASKEVENSIMRIAQLARACGIYLVIATQRPSVNVISGSIKTNVPSRISFAVAAGVDSQTILDRRGAEKLLGHGDMLYFPQGIPEPVRVQGCYVSENEILNIVSYVKDSGVLYDTEVENIIEKGGISDSPGSLYDPNEKDDLFYEAGKLIIEQKGASIGLLQRRYRIGFNRAARIIDQLEASGIVSKQDGKKPREVLMDIDEFNEKFGG